MCVSKSHRMPRLMVNRGDGLQSSCAYAPTWVLFALIVGSPVAHCMMYGERYAYPWLPVHDGLQFTLSAKKNCGVKLFALSSSYFTKSSAAPTFKTCSPPLWKPV